MNTNKTSAKIRKNKTAKSLRIIGALLFVAIVAMLCLNLYSSVLAKDAQARKENSIARRNLTNLGFNATQYLGTDSLFYRFTVGGDTSAVNQPISASALVPGDVEYAIFAVDLVERTATVNGESGKYTSTELSVYSLVTDFDDINYRDLDAQGNPISKDLAEALDIYVVDLQTDDILYQNTLRNFLDTYIAPSAANPNGNPLVVDISATPDTTDTLYFGVVVAMPTNVTSYYENLGIEFDLYWAGNSVFVPDTSQAAPSPTPTGGDDEEPPYTAEDAFSYILFAVIALGALFCIFFILFLKQRKEEVDEMPEEERKHHKRLASYLRKVWLHVLIIAVIVAVFAGSALAVTKAVAEGSLVGNTIISGDVELTIVDDEGNRMESIFNEDTVVNPGETVVGYFNVKNVGNVAFFYQIHVEGVGDTDGDDVSLADALIFTIYKDGVSTPVYRGPASEWVGVEEEEALQVNDSDRYIIFITMPEELGNEYQRQAMGFNIIVDAVQAKNQTPGAVDFYND